MDDSKLTPSDYLELVVEAGIGAIPVVGGPIQTLYFGRQNEIRFKRIESFYKELNIELEKISGKIPKIENESINRDQLLGILETINDQVEKARTQSKINLYKNLYKNCILGINNSSWNEEEYFLEVLNSLTSIQIELIIFLQSQGDDFVGDIIMRGTSQELIDGSLNKLSDLGILEKTITSIVMGDIGKQNLAYKLSDLGKKFIVKTFACVS